MAIHNTEIVAIFNELADLLDIQGANPFRIRAYRRAAETIASLPDSLEVRVAAGEDLSSLPTIGKDLAAKIIEIVETGHLTLLDELEKAYPADLARMLTITGLGPKRVKILHDLGGINTLSELRDAAEAGRISALPGLGKKTEQMILQELDSLAMLRSRWLRSAIEPWAQELKAWLKARPGVDKVEIAGSYRRRKETVGDLDILVTCASDVSNTLISEFTRYESVQTILSRGVTRSTVILRSGLQVDLRVVPPGCFGAALHYFTGSKSHNIAIRRMAQRKGWKVNEYGVFHDRKHLAGKTEASVYKLFGMPVIPPELREDRGEFAAARNEKLPDLIETADLRGDLHVHTKASDGRASIAQMIDAAQCAGLDYIAITDHSQHARIANGLDVNRLHRQLDDIDRINESLENFRLLKSCEVDILKDGTLDLDASVLSRLDLRVCAVHDGFALSGEAQTDRILRAMDNPLFNILAHPTGRLIGKRVGYVVDMPRLIEGARQRRCILEINSSARRLDLNDIDARLAAEAGVLLAISSDAHDPAHFRQLAYGVDQARRGWIESHQVLNTRPLNQALKALRR